MAPYLCSCTTTTKYTIYRPWGQLQVTGDGFWAEDIALERVQINAYAKETVGKGR